MFAFFDRAFFRGLVGGAVAVVIGLWLLVWWSDHQTLQQVVQVIRQAQQQTASSAQSH